jgi:hypothetical protein
MQMDAISRFFFQLDVNCGSLHVRYESPCERLAQLDQLQAIFSIFAIIFGVNPSVCITAL